MFYEPLFKELNTPRQLVLKDKVVCSCKKPFNGELILKSDGTFSCVGYCSSNKFCSSIQQDIFSCKKRPLFKIRMKKVSTIHKKKIITLDYFLSK